MAGEPGHCPIVVVITVSSVSQGDCYHALWDRLSFNHLMYFVLPKNVCNVLK